MQSDMLRLRLACCLFLCATEGATAAQPFSGAWEIDLRTPEQKARRLECGTAGFELVQRGKMVSGDHSMAAASCGRVNEGGAGTVHGVVRGHMATLTITSGRNGQVVRGKAWLENDKLHWKTLEELKPGDPPSDSGLILRSGVLTRTVK